MKVLVLTRNPAFTNLCQKAFAEAAENIAEAEPLRALTSPVENEFETVLAASDNITAGRQIHTGYQRYVTIAGAPLKDNFALSKIYTIAIGYGGKDQPVLLKKLRVPVWKNENTQILNALQTLLKENHTKFNADQIPLHPEHA